MAENNQQFEPMVELVFRNRNKEYGAYVLRKKYKKYVIIATVISLIILGATVAYPVIASYLNKSKLIKEEKSVETEMLNMPKEDLPPPPPPPPPPEALEQKVKFTAPVVVNDTVDENFGKQDELAAKPNTEAPPEEDIKVEETKEKVIEQVEAAPVFTIVEEMPAFSGGEAELYKYLHDNTKYPEEAKELGIQGRVYVTFVVETDGSITAINIVRGIGGGCDEEAVRVVKSMPRWTPGKQRGVPVRVQFNLPIKFTLQ